MCLHKYRQVQRLGKRLQRWMDGRLIKREVNQLEGVGASWDVAGWRPDVVLTHLRENKPKEVTFWWLSISGDRNLTSDWLITLWKTSPLSVCTLAFYIFVYLLPNTLCTGDTHTHAEQTYWLCCTIWCPQHTPHNVQSEQVVKWWLPGCGGHAYLTNSKLNGRGVAVFPHRIHLWFLTPCLLRDAFKGLEYSQ